MFLIHFDGGADYNIPQGHLSAMTPEQMQAYRWEREIDERNR